MSWVSDELVVDDLRDAGSVRFCQVLSGSVLSLLLLLSETLSGGSSHLVVALLAVVRLVASLVAGVGVLFIRPLLGVGVRCSGLLLRRRSPHEGSDDARLLKDEPEVSRPQDQVNEAKSLKRR